MAGELMKKLAVFIATGFGLGFSPFAPGTAGALPGVLIAWLISPLSVFIQAGIAVGLVLLAVPLCGIAEEFFNSKDDRRIVADEYMTFPVCMVGLPANVWTLPAAFVMVPFAFVASRLLDIIKPPPARQIQRIHGGAGIVLDDFFANVYGLALNHVAWHYLEPFLRHHGLLV